MPLIILRMTISEGFTKYKKGGGRVKKMEKLARKAKKASNITTLVLMIYLAFTLSKWHSIAGLDRFIDLLIFILILAVNIKFYLTYANLGGFKSDAIDKDIELSYKHASREYHSLMRIALWMGIILFVGKLLIN
jgi:hypothetical protein